MTVDLCMVLNLVTMNTFVRLEFEKVNIDELVSVCLSVYLSLASDLSEMIALGMVTFFRQENGSHVNYIDLDLHSRSRRS